MFSAEKYKNKERSYEDYLDLVDSVISFHRVDQITYTVRLVVFRMDYPTGKFRTVRGLRKALEKALDECDQAYWSGPMHKEWHINIKLRATAFWKKKMYEIPVGKRMSIKTGDIWSYDTNFHQEIFV